MRRAKSQCDWIPWALGGGVGLALIALLALLVSILPCPDSSFSSATGIHEYGGTPALTCLYCGDCGRITLLAKWRWYRDCRVTEEQIEEGVQQGREKIAPDWK
jgi:hypothetical protein